MFWNKRKLTEFDFYFVLFSETVHASADQWWQCHLSEKYFCRASTSSGSSQSNILSLRLYDVYIVQSHPHCNRSQSPLDEAAVAIFFPKKWSRWAASKRFPSRNNNAPRLVD
jgi:hypothetical protein